MEERVISQCPKRITQDCKIILKSFYEKKNWTVNVENKDKEYVCSVWLGSNPQVKWKPDGLIRIGYNFNDTHWEVWQTFQRYSDGSYKLIKSSV